MRAWVGWVVWAGGCDSVCFSLSLLLSGASALHQLSKYIQHTHPPTSTPTPTNPTTHRRRAPSAVGLSLRACPPAGAARAPRASPPTYIMCCCEYCVAPVPLSPAPPPFFPQTKTYYKLIGPSLLLLPILPPPRPQQLPPPRHRHRRAVLLLHPAPHRHVHFHFEDQGPVRIVRPPLL